MGCDIHLYAEIKDQDGTWIEIHEEIFEDRNYYLFAILAGVRNYKEIKPITEPRGIPSNCTLSVREKYEAWDSDAHSASYLTLAELLAFDWTQVFNCTGMVDATTYKDWVEWRKDLGEGPQMYSRMVGGRNVKEISVAEMDRVVLNWNTTPNKENLYCLASWDLTYAKVSSEFWVRAIPKLLALGKPEDVRIVFWFDN